MATSPKKPPPDENGQHTNIGGRYGSPTITVALPFSSVTRVESDIDDDVAELAEIVSRLASAIGPVDDPGQAEVLALARTASHALARRLAERS